MEAALAKDLKPWNRHLLILIQGEIYTEAQVFVQVKGQVNLT